MQVIYNATSAENAFNIMICLILFSPFPSSATLKQFCFIHSQYSVKLYNIDVHI